MQSHIYTLYSYIASYYIFVTPNPAIDNLAELEHCSYHIWRETLEGANWQGKYNWHAEKLAVS